jgi:hypothetical protein
LTADILFLNSEGTGALNCKKKTFSAAEAKLCELSISMGHPLKIIDCGKPTADSANRLAAIVS